MVKHLVKMVKMKNYLNRLQPAPILGLGVMVKMVKMISHKNKYLLFSANLAPYGPNNKIFFFYINHLNHLNQNGSSPYVARLCGWLRYPEFILTTS